MENELLRIDLGCGSNKKEGTIGVDMAPGPGVDFVMDLTSQPLPFPDRSVGYVHSSHFLEHVEAVLPLFTEISRVCKDGAELEIWTPYAWSNAAHVFGHVTSFSEDTYLHLTWYSDFWSQSLGAYWIFNEIRYVIDPDVLVYLNDREISVDFAVKHLKDVAREFGVFVILRHTTQKPNQPKIRRTFSTGRYDQVHEIREEVHPQKTFAQALEAAITANTASADS